MTTLHKALPSLLLALVALWVFSSHQARAQSQNDCTAFTTTVTGDANGQTVTNLSQNSPCVQWRITFSVTGTLSTSVTFQTSPDNSTWTAVPNTICSASVQPPCVIQGANPTSGTQGSMYLSAYGAYVRVITSGSSGTGTGTIRVYGAKGATANAGAGLGGGSGNLVFSPSDPAGSCTSGTDANIQNTTTGEQWACVGGSWALIVSAFSRDLIFYWTNTASDISTYLVQQAAPYTPKTTLAFNSLAAGTATLKNWATIVTAPNVAFLPAGEYVAHLHALRSGAAGSVVLFVQFWEVDATGVDIAQIGQSESSTPLTTTESEYSLVFVDANTYTLASTASRIVARLRVTVVGGSTPNVNIFVGGTADSSTILPGSAAGGGAFPAGSAGQIQLNATPFTFAAQASIFSGGTLLQRGVECSHGTVGFATVAAAGAVTSTEISIQTGISGDVAYDQILVNASTPFTFSSGTGPTVSMGRTGATNNFEMTGTLVPIDATTPWTARPVPPALTGTYGIVLNFAMTTGNVNALTAGSLDWRICGYLAQ